ncbi:flavin reductase family protein [Skermania sp. ID1734]|uniref:flavin reductase family protein n=1 Tax=Skermania sp. ID1734 TaxID=2597516 RepID=UPI001180F363|nr:flavin reductase family protein [Skermania sp. ID1734]TSE01572.1 flavin reductase family protein [Skermania sp. ID1734]
MVEQRELRNVFGQFASGVTVITCRNGDGSPHGATVTAFTAVSMQPRLCQITMTRKSKACTYLRNAPFAVNVLAADQVDTAMHFAGRPCIPEPSWAEGPTAPIICGAAATFSCEPWAEYDGGDHIIFIGHIVDAVATGKQPLIFYRSTFHELGVPSAHVPWNGSCDDPLTGWFGATASFTPMYSHTH